MSPTKTPRPQSAPKERDQGFSRSHGYGAAHGGPTGPGDAPAPVPASSPDAALAPHTPPHKRPSRGAIAPQVEEKVLAALQRQATVDADSIHIETDGGKVTLTGYASSWQAIEDAANAAWATPGVTEVIDQVKREMTF